MNKVVERLYREERLTLRRRNRKKIARRRLVPDRRHGAWTSPWMARGKVPHRL